MASSIYKLLAQSLHLLSCQSLVDGVPIGNTFDSCSLVAELENLAQWKRHRRGQDRHPHCGLTSMVLSKNALSIEMRTHAMFVAEQNKEDAEASRHHNSGRRRIEEAW